MNRLTELRETLLAQNAGKHYLKRVDETDCVEMLCTEIDSLRQQLAAARLDSERLDWLPKADIGAEAYTDLIECNMWARKTFPSLRSAIDSARQAPEGKE